MTPPYLTLFLVSILAILWIPFVGSAVRKLIMEPVLDWLTRNSAPLMFLGVLLWLWIPTLTVLLATGMWWVSMDVFLLLAILLRLFGFLE